MRVAARVVAQIAVAVRLFCERNGYGHLMLWRSGHVLGPIASLGFGPGSYGHHDRAVRWGAA